MHAPRSANAGFKRQVVFRLGPEEWPLLESAASVHGSIQAAVVAGLRALTSATNPGTEASDPAPDGRPEEPGPPRAQASAKRTPKPRPEPRVPEEELTAREAAEILGVKTSTVSGYIRSGRLPGRYEEEPGWRGWLTPRSAVEAYSARRT